jgi:hypothetical protein
LGFRVGVRVRVRVKVRVRLRVRVRARARVRVRVRARVRNRVRIKVRVRVRVKGVGETCISGSLERNLAVTNPIPSVEPVIRAIRFAIAIENPRTKTNTRSTLILYYV